MRCSEFPVESFTLFSTDNRFEISASILLFLQNLPLLHKGAYQTTEGRKLEKEEENKRDKNNSSSFPLFLLLPSIVLLRCSVVCKEYLDLG